MGGGFLREYKVNQGGDYGPGNGDYEYGEGEYYEYGEGDEYGAPYDYEGGEGADTKLPEEEDIYEDYVREKGDVDEEGDKQNQMVIMILPNKEERYKQIKPGFSMERHGQKKLR